MTTPSVTLRSLKNKETGIDISVPGFQEEEAPLGGTSILYEISVQTTLDLYKTRLHKEDDVVNFSIFKAYREIEELSNKLNKKYPKAGLLRVPNVNAVDKYTNDEKVEALDCFVKTVAKNIEICLSSIFTQFIGVNSQKSPSFGVPSAQSESDAVASDESDELFHKVKTEKKAAKPEEPVLKVVKSIDLFDKDDSKVKSSANVKNATAQSLFDDFEDDDLFSSQLVTKKPAQIKQITETKKPDPPAPKQKPVKPTPDEIDDSGIIIKDRKFGDVSLFEQQDFGDYITKDEEALFMVTAPTKAKKNELLSPKNKILSPEKDTDVNEDLDDLLNLVPLPVSPTEAQEEKELPHRPVPLPRKKSITKTEPEVPQKPEVLPRKVFLKKEENPPKGPSVPPKPVPGGGQAKPKPPPKRINPAKNESKTAAELDAENANKPESNANNVVKRTSSLSDQLKDLDILHYIEQEQKSLDSNLSLFD